MNATADRLRLFLAGDAMTGRGIDQVLEHSVDPQLFEPFVRDANDYVELAEVENGPINRPVDDDYIWGDGLRVLEQFAPDARIVNLETAITAGGTPWPGKGIHYRMQPANTGCLTALGPHACALANNHLLDWDRDGLIDTLDTLERHGLAGCGAGRDLTEAQRPVVLEPPPARVRIFAFGHGSSGIPDDWAASERQPGVWRLDDLSLATARSVARVIDAGRDDEDLVVASIHVGGNWGFDIDPAWREFAHALIDTAGVDVVHGHSSHHPRPIEVHHGRLILHGCGDLINDYEGIGGHAAYRPELAVMYFADLDPASGVLCGLELVPMKIRNFRLERAGDEDARWLARTLSAHAPSGTPALILNDHGALRLENP